MIMVGDGFFGTFKLLKYLLIKHLIVMKVLFTFDISEIYEHYNEDRNHHTFEWLLPVLPVKDDYIDHDLIRLVMDIKNEQEYDINVQNKLHGFPAVHDITWRVYEGVITPEILITEKYD